MITGGFGMELDLQTGRVRHWYVGRDGIQGWAGNDQPVKEPIAAAENARED